MSRVLLLLPLIFFLSCTSKSVRDPIDSSESMVNIMKVAPKWVKDPKETNSIGAVGKAFRTTGGVKFQQTEAVANGKDLLRDRVEKVVFTALSRAIIVINENNELELQKEFIEDTAKKIAVYSSLNSVKEAEKKSVWFDEVESLYVLMSVQDDIVKKHTYSGLEIIFRNYEELSKLYKEEKIRESISFYIDKYLYEFH